MAAFTKDVSNAVWHAFDALDDHRNGRVMKSRLKVLTASLGTLLGCQNVEKGLQEHRSTQDLCFDDFLFYLQKELFSFLLGSVDYKTLQRYHDQIEEVCWLVCKKKFLRRDYVAFPDNCVFQFFRVFCLLGELHQEPKKPVEVLLAAEEVEHVAMMFNHALGQNWDSADFQGIAEVIPLFRFQVFIALLESRYTQSVEVKGLIEATKEVFDIFVNDVLRKGSLRKRIARLGIWRELWFVLQPHTLTYYSNKEEGDKRGEMQLTTKSRVETLPSSPSGKGFRFSVMSGDKILDLSAPDHKNKLQWIIALQTAFQFSQASESYQRHLANKRKSDRLLAKARKEEEEANRLQQQQQLEYLTKARIEAEEAIQAESQRRHMLEEEQRKLEKQLEEERQAKRDEEIVRNLLSKSLMEEWEHRERLERLKAEKEKRLAEEQKRRLELETAKKKEDENEQFVKRLSNLETEKLELHSTLQVIRKCCP
ncbi:LOW QUALITY PROTEIN: switch-associated protein 70-like [Limulus polyphemus]|uniref:LOW QUALITY PROTEIN: switch-associated protein 70-like n=1 Tax=Limulus polyphemus TaxID=6850 RepID=A0ABM1SCF1_LIMPO|nr:LOW QUALITY PROTEIN: switch-associated protein 70-like [Limulus polyphemus]